MKTTKLFNIDEFVLKLIPLFGFVLLIVFTSYVAFEEKNYVPLGLITGIAVPIMAYVLSLKKYGE